MKRMHIWLATLHYNFVAWMWERYNRKETPRRYPTVGDYVNKARAELERPDISRQFRRQKPRKRHCGPSTP